MARIKIDDIKNELSTCGWKVLSDTYVNLDTEMEFECAEGHRVFTSWKKLRAKLECPICAANQYKTQPQITITPKKKGDFRVLALDQATKISGWALYTNNSLETYGIHKSENEDTVIRNHEMKEWAISLAHSWEVDLVAIEGIQMQTTTYGANVGVTTFEALARLQGVMLEAFYEQGIPVMICPTNTWRHHCGVKGRSREEKKTSMRKLVKQWYDITVTDDVADAIGIGKYATETRDKKRIKSNARDWE